ncbi:extracellular matrix regulator RemB [Caldalkalibacillus salinus]|uniref:extracellular matrix regulator RemB n=1 Tax=Caldalkalibacillus salinus TaxID=2803787 RepID=UPI001923CFF6|nr:extracellular matrix/biofilm biosynthesis regulator RemA family protein [Caldalkalibacillus salinus]
MYIHLGGDIVVQAKEIIAILEYSPNDLDLKSYPFIDQQEEAGSITWIAKDATKSIVVTEDHVYGSPISSLTLNRRALGDHSGY